MPPNLFRYATSELSQDAFLAWILEWSDPINSHANPALHHASLDLVTTLLGRDERVESRPVTVHLQLKWVDLAVEFGDEEVLVIEDKTTSSVKRCGERLALDDYAKSIQDHYPRSRRLAFGYLKTGDEHPPPLSDPWKRFGRRHLLDALEPHVSAAKSDILSDFVERLLWRENRVNAWTTLPFSEWHTDAWKGLFMAMATDLSHSRWNYQANARGGEFVLWWGEHRGVYPLIRVWPSVGPEGRLNWARPHSQLTVRMNPASARIGRRDLEGALIEMDARFRPPRRRSSGKSFRIAEFHGNFLHGADGIVDGKRTSNALEDFAVALRTLVD